MKWIKTKSFDLINLDNAFEITERITKNNDKKNIDLVMTCKNGSVVTIINNLRDYESRFYRVKIERFINSKNPFNNILDMNKLVNIKKILK